MYNTQKPIKIVVIGASGNGLDIVDTLLDINQSLGTEKYTCIGFLDDKPQLQGKEIYLGYKVLGKISDISQFDDDVYFVTAIGSSKSFLQKPSILAHIPLSRFRTIIHPTAYISHSTTIGIGTVILQQVTVTNNVSIGNYVTVLPHTVINHDCIIEDYTCIASSVSLSGGVKIGQNCYIGTNTAIKEQVTIGKKCLIGMGSNVLQDVPEYSIVMGNPARIQSTLEK